MPDVDTFAREADDRARAMERRIGDEIAIALRVDDPVEAIFEVIEPEFARTYDTPGVSEFVSVRRTLAGAWGWFRGTLQDALDRLDVETEMELQQQQAQRLASWLSVATINGALVAAGQREDGKTWVSQRDGRVRSFHVEADGQTVPMSQPFVVCDGQRLMYPGQPVGDPECWISCRCFLVPVPDQAVTAAVADDLDTIVVLIPAADDPVNDIVDNDYPPHMTVAYLDEVPGEREDGVATAVSTLAYTAAPITMPVLGIRELGDEEKVTVLEFDPLGFEDRREELVADPRVAPHVNKKWPTWIPHVTLGPIGRDYGSVDSVTFDRVGLWQGEHREEYAMNGDAVDTVESESEDDMSAGLIPWYGVLAPEGVASGDGRRFSQGALTWRDLPLPLRWQKADSDGHGGSVVVGRIDTIERRGDLLNGTGVFLSNPDADEIIGHLAERAVRGLSVDVDSAEMSVDEDGDFRGVEFSRGRICSVAIVAIPAFEESYIALGTPPVDEPVQGEFRDVSTEERKRLADKNQAMPDGSFPIANCEDLRNAVQAIGRAKDPDAVKRHIKKRASALNCPGFELPEGWAADAEEFAAGTKDGPGWISHPVPTARIRRYWTKGEGAAKIRWGTDGDFTRCVRNLRKYIANPDWLNGTCANLHKEALGYWPGDTGKPGNPPVGSRRHHSGDTVTLIAAATTCYPPELFADPCFTCRTPLEVYEHSDGMFGVRGHLAGFDDCHVGMKDVCMTAPKSATGYRMFRTGAVRLSDGTLQPVGQITMGTGHAALSARPRAAAAHYDDTGTAIADVTCGEDACGIWVAGVIRPGVTEEQRTVLQASALSGDWRSIGGNLELVAALVVNVPGFPVPRVGLAASGEEGQTVLVAAGVVTEAEPAPESVPESVPEPEPAPDDDFAERVGAAVARAVRSERIMAQVRRERVGALSDI